MDDKNKYNFEVCLKKAERGDRNDQYNLGVLLLLLFFSSSPSLLRLLPLLLHPIPLLLLSSHPNSREHVITWKGMRCG